MKQYKKWLRLGILLCLVGILVCAVSYWQQQKSSKRWELVYIPKTVDGTNDFWTSLISGTRMAAKEYNAEIEVIAPDREQDVERQNEILRQAIEDKPDAILISPSSFTASDELLRQAKDKGIPLTFIDSYTSEDIQDLTVATDNLEVGKKLGEFAREMLDEDSQVAIVEHVKGVSTAIEREEGFREGLGDLEKNIVEVVYCNSSYEKSYELTMDLLEKYPNLKMIAGLNEYSSVGAARAVKAAGAKDRVKIVGVDSSQEAVQLMEQGVFRGLVVQKAFKMGYVGVRDTIRMLNGEKVVDNVDSGSQLVTPENMYNSEIEKLLFPFNTVKQSTDTEEERQ
ncbi:MAG: substrate-binding domain-containing protein [Eubacteriales bacterium]|nr:substrate-binding domain-containing protein [Eubacteriales bacterium]